MRKQRGVTMLGWIFLLTPLAIVLYAGIRLAPPYLNYYKVIQALDQTATEFRGDDAIAPTTIVTALGKRFEIGYVEKPVVTDIKIAKNASGQWEMAMDYEEVVPMFGNLYLLLQFKKNVPIK